MSKREINTDINNKLREVVALDRLRESSKQHFAALSDREKQVLILVAMGLANPEISSKLGISRPTVQNHRASIRQKLQIKKDIDYLKFALAHDLIRFQ